MSTPVLVVEDGVIIRCDISQNLEMSGFTVFEAANADEAIDLLRLHNEIELVFTDVRMPGSMDGLGLAKWTRENMPDVIVMITSGHISKTLIGEQLGNVEIFIKPYDPRAVVTKICNAIMQKRIESALGSEDHQKRAIR